MENYRKSYKVNDDLTLYGAFWPTLNGRANVLIITGMEEHALRYTEFALFLNANGFNVYSLDFYGQGENIVRGISKKGEVPDGAFMRFIDHLGVVAMQIKKDKLPLYILGHSMGSFMAQHFMQRYPELASKVVIVGSNGPSILFGLGHLVASLTVNKQNRHKESVLLSSLSIGSYAKSIKPARTQADWLSYNTDNVDMFLKDPLDGGPSTKGFYRELLHGTSSLYKKANYARVGRDLPLFIIAGQDDPVGLKGKGVLKLHNFYKRLGFNHVFTKIYPKMRHEILNETNRKQVYNDVLAFLNE